ncbi:MAG: hypothetical protein IPG96_18630 [Proteobacteria bacterium]|nr:hypothetical protein [Pseudomonadota bacterium]
MHACALRSDGRLLCWGSNGTSQVGDGTTVARHSPTIITAVGTTVMKVTAANSASCARRFDGSLLCWGVNDDGKSVMAPRSIARPPPPSRRSGPRLRSSRRVGTTPARGARTGVCGVGAATSSAPSATAPRPLAGSPSP